MPVRFFCNDCNKEIFFHIDEYTKELLSIKEIESQCYCEQCLLNNMIKEEIEAAREELENQKS